MFIVYIVSNHSGRARGITCAWSARIADAALVRGLTSHESVWAVPGTLAN